MQQAGADRPGGQEDAGDPGQVHAGLVLRAAKPAWFDRVMATWLDVIVVGFPGLGLMVAGAATAEPRYPGDDNPLMTPIGIGLAWSGIVLYLVIWCWNRYVRAARAGQSLGKQWRHVRLVGAEGTTRPVGGTEGTARPTTGRLVRRDVAHLLDVLPCFLGFFWAAWDRRGQTFADKLLGTTVVVA